MHGIFNVCLLALVVAGALTLTLISLFRHNRLLFWCLFGALLMHVTAAGCVWSAGLLLTRVPDEQHIAITISPLDQPPPIPPVTPKPREVKPIITPLGHPDSRDKDATPKKGSPAAHPTANNIVGTKYTIHQRTDSTKVDVQTEPRPDGEIYSTGDSLDPRDLPHVGPGRLGDAGMEHGDERGTGIPPGFTTGQIDGRVYFIRLKHGSGAWNAYNDGTNRLLTFLGHYVKCESESRALTSGELYDKFISKGALPSFIYIYADESFALSGSDVQVLHDYLVNDGFLFIDSRPDPFIKEKVANELDKVLPGARLTAIANSHPINSFLFKLSSPGIGMNVIVQKNYGVSRDGRLVVFYTMGNFSFLYSEKAPDSLEYINAQYQMGANVMYYAINKGSTEGIQQYKGANPTVTTQALDKLGAFDNGNAPPPPSTGKPESQRLPPAENAANSATSTAGHSVFTNQPPMAPDDIIVNEQR